LASLAGLAIPALVRAPTGYAGRNGRNGRNFDGGGGDARKAAATTIKPAYWANHRVVRMQERQGRIKRYARYCDTGLQRFELTVSRLSQILIDSTSNTDTTSIASCEQTTE